MNRGGGADIEPATETLAVRRDVRRAATFRLLQSSLAGAATGAISFGIWLAARPVRGWDSWYPDVVALLVIFGALAGALTFASLQRTTLATLPLRTSLTFLPIAWCAAVVIAAIFPKRLDDLLVFILPPVFAFATGLAMYLRSASKDDQEKSRSRTPQRLPTKIALTLLAFVAAYGTFCGFMLFAYGLPAVGILGQNVAPAMFGAVAPVPIVALFPVTWVAWNARLPDGFVLACIILSHSVAGAVIVWRVGQSALIGFTGDGVAANPMVLLPWLSFLACVAGWLVLKSRTRSTHGEV